MSQFTNRREDVVTEAIDGVLAPAARPMSTRGSSKAMSIPARRPSPASSRILPADLSFQSPAEAAAKTARWASKARR